MNRWNSLLKMKLGSDGFSLMEMMVGGAILIGASLAAVKMFSDQKISQRKIELDRILDAHISMLKMTLAAKTNCNATMQTGSIVNCTLVHGPAFVAPCSKAINNMATINSLISDFPTTLNAIKSTSGDVVTVGSRINDQNTHVLNSIAVVNPGQTGLVRLNLDYRAVQFGTTIRRSLFVPIKFSADGTYECMDDKMGVEKTLQKEGCEALGVYGDYAADAQDCANRNIKALDSAGVGQFSCPAGNDVVGVRSTGEVICATVNSHFIPNSNTVSPTPATGCNGKQVRLRVMPDNKVGVECF